MIIGKTEIFKKFLQRSPSDNAFLDFNIDVGINSNITIFKFNPNNSDGPFFVDEDFDKVSIKISDISDNQLLAMVTNTIAESPYI